MIVKNGKMGKLGFKPRTLDDQQVKDGLSAVSALERDPASRETSFVVGGIATQGYVPSQYRRPTSDIDLAVLRPLTFEDFKTYSGSAAEFLRDMGYEVKEKKGHISHQLIFSDEGGGNAAIIEFPRRNNNNYQKRAVRLEREYENSRRKIVEGRAVTYHVSSPEDIAAPKMVRSVGVLGRHPAFCEYIESGEPIASSPERIRQDFQMIDGLRDEAIVHIGDTRASERLRFVSDLFDIRALSEVVGFNRRYMGEVMASWDVLNGDNPSKDLLVNYLLPHLADEH